MADYLPARAQTARRAPSGPLHSDVLSSQLDDYPDSSIHAYRSELSRHAARPSFGDAASPRPRRLAMPRSGSRSARSSRKRISPRGGSGAPYTEVYELKPEQQRPPPPMSAATVARLQGLPAIMTDPFVADRTSAARAPRRH